MGDLAIEVAVFNGKDTPGNPTEHGGGGCRIGKLANCAARAAAAIIGCGGAIWFCGGDRFKLMGNVFGC